MKKLSALDTTGSNGSHVTNFSNRALTVFSFGLGSFHICLGKKI